MPFQVMTLSKMSLGHFPWLKAKTARYHVSKCNIELTVIYSHHLWRRYLSIPQSLRARKLLGFRDDGLHYTTKMTIKYVISHFASVFLVSWRYVPESWGNLITHILQSNRNHPTAGHLSYNKMLELLQWDYIWPSIHFDCKKYVTQFLLCARNEPSRHCPYSLLQPLPILEHPWNSQSAWTS